MYKYLEHGDKKYPIRVSNSVIGEWQEDTGKMDIKNMSFRDIRILLWHSLMEGYEFADRKFDLTMKDVKLMLENVETVKAFVQIIPEFFPKQKEEPEPGKPKRKPQPKE